jgi:iron complex transport system substrate-binding protein
VRRRALALLLPLLLAACSAGEEAASEPAAPSGPARIVILAPAAAEMVAALGGVERVVGIGDYVDWPPGELPRLGPYDRPNVERILALEADLLLTTDSRAADETHRALRRLGVEVLALDTSTYEGVFTSLHAVGRALGAEARAGALETAMRNRLVDLESRTAGLPRRRVLVVVGRDPLYVAGPGSHVDRLIEIAAGTNVAADAASTYQQFSLEAALERLPEVIVDASDNAPGALRGRVAGSWGRFPFLPAVESNRVWHVAPERLLIPGLELPEAAELLARLLHPEIFGEPDPARLLPDVVVATAGASPPSADAEP